MQTENISEGGFSAPFNRRGVEEAV